MCVRDAESGDTPLHHASHGGHPDIVKLLLARGADVNAIEKSYEATPLGWAMYGYLHPSPEAKRARHHEVVEQLVGAGAKIETEWLEDAKVRGDERMRAALAAKR
jgi:ankyrin repeat protein